MIWFLISFIVGGLVGIAMMCLLFISKEDKA